MYALVMQYDNMMVWGSVIETDIEYFDMILYDNIMLIQFNLSFTIFPGWGGYADHQARDIWIGEAHGWTLAGISGAMGLSKLCIKRRLVQGMRWMNRERFVGFVWFIFGCGFDFLQIHTSKKGVMPTILLFFQDFAFAVQILCWSFHIWHRSCNFDLSGGNTHSERKGSFVISGPRTQSSIVLKWRWGVRCWLLSYWCSQMYMVISKKR